MISHFVFYNLPILWRQYTHNRDVANHKPPKYSEQYRGIVTLHRMNWWKNIFLYRQIRTNVQKKEVYMYSRKYFGENFQCNYFFSYYYSDRG